MASYRTPGLPLPSIFPSRPRRGPRRSLVWPEVRVGISRRDVSRKGENGSHRRPRSVPDPLPPLPTPAATLSDEGWVSLVRVLVLLALIPALWFGIIRVTAATWIVPLLGGYVLLLALCPRRLPLIQRPDLVVMLDLLVTTLLVVASGNLDSPFLYVYYLTLLEAVARFNLRQSPASSTAPTAI